MKAWRADAVGVGLRAEHLACHPADLWQLLPVRDMLPFAVPAAHSITPARFAVCALTPPRLLRRGYTCRLHQRGRARCRYTAYRLYRTRAASSILFSSVTCFCPGILDVVTLNDGQRGGINGKSTSENIESK